MLHLLKTLFNTSNERHAFLIGFSETLCPWPPRYRQGTQTPEYLEREYHYYTFGRAVGFIALLALIILFKKLLWR